MNLQKYSFDIVSNSYLLKILEEKDILPINIPYLVEEDSTENIIKDKNLPIQVQKNLGLDYCFNSEIAIYDFMQKLEEGNELKGTYYSLIPCLNPEPDNNNSAVQVTLCLLSTTLSVVGLEQLFSSCLYEKFKNFSSPLKSVYHCETNTYVLMDGSSNILAEFFNHEFYTSAIIYPISSMRLI